MIMREGCNKVAFGCTDTKCPTSFNTKKYFIRTKMILNRKKVGKSSVNGTNKHVHIDELKKILFCDNP